MKIDEMDEPADQSVLYAISSKDGNIKGLLVNGFGIYSESLSNDMLKALT